MNNALSDENIYNLSIFILNKFNTNNPNFLGVNEIKNMLDYVLNNPNYTKSVTYEDAKEFLITYDRDKDGYIGLNDLGNGLNELIGINKK